MQHRADEISKKLISVLKKDSESINYFQNEIERIEKLNVSWKQNIIRVGIIGITSSGKSTLLNAILGEDLLPGKVAPTSGVIVGSMKGDEFKVNIKYNDGKTENIFNKKQTRKKLLTLADEKNNPNNKYNVNQIEIKSPKFIPPYNNLKILDSPGLNACNLETYVFNVTF